MTLANNGGTPGISDSDRPTSVRLIDEAVKLFSEHGYHAATTRDLADRLGIKKASLYHHIATKDDLLYKICSESVTRAGSAVRRASENSPAPQRLREMVRAHLVTVLRDRDLHRVAVTEMRGLTPQRLDEITKARDAYSRMYYTTIRQDQADGRIRSDRDPRLATSALLSMLNWPVFWLSDNDTTTAETLSDFILSVYLDGVGVRD